MPLAYIAKRMFHLTLILLGVSVLVFLMLRMIPGDPARLLLGEYATQDDLARLRGQMGLDRPYPVQYGIYLGGLLQGDLGNSLRNGAPVAEEIGARLMATLELAIAAMLIASVRRDRGGGDLRGEPVLGLGRRSTAWCSSESPRPYSGGPDAR